MCDTILTKSTTDRGCFKLCGSEIPGPAVTQGMFKSHMNPSSPNVIFSINEIFEVKTGLSLKLASVVVVVFNVVAVDVIIQLRIKS